MVPRRHAATDQSLYRLTSRQVTSLSHAKNSAMKLRIIIYRESHWQSRILRKRARWHTKNLLSVANSRNSGR